MVLELKSVLMAGGIASKVTAEGFGQLLPQDQAVLVFVRRMRARQMLESGASPVSGMP